MIYYDLDNPIRYTRAPIHNTSRSTLIIVGDTVTP